MPKPAILCEQYGLCWTPFPLGVWNRGRCLAEADGQLPIPGHWIAQACLLNISQVLSQLITGGISAHVARPLEGNWKLVPLLPGRHPMCLFPLQVLLCTLSLIIVLAVSRTRCWVLWVLTRHRTCRWSSGPLAPILKRLTLCRITTCAFSFILSRGHWPNTHESRVCCGA